VIPETQVTSLQPFVWDQFAALKKEVLFS